MVELHEIKYVCFNQTMFGPLQQVRTKKHNVIEIQQENKTFNNRDGQHNEIKYSKKGSII